MKCITAIVVIVSFVSSCMRASVLESTQEKAVKSVDPVTNAQSVIEELTPPNVAYVDMPIDLSKAWRHLAEARALGKTPQFNILCGALSPITLFHMKMLDLARDQINNDESSPYYVVGDYVSPVSARYGKPTLIANEYRIELCKAACIDSDYAVCESWEAAQPVYLCTYFVLQRFREELKKVPEFRDAKIMFVCGYDLFSYFKTPIWKASHIEKILNEFGLIVIQREGKDIQELIDSMPHLKAGEGNIISVQHSDDPHDVSSSMVRARLAAGESIEGLLSPKVAEIIYEKGHYGAIRPFIDETEETVDSEEIEVIVPTESGAASTGDCT